MFYTFTRTTLIICHVGIWVLWSVTSRGRNIESFLKTWVHIRSIPIVLFEILGFIQILVFPTSAHLSLQIMGLLTAIFGTVLASWAKIVMGTNWGRPAQHDKNVQSQLVTGGPFAYSRNPIYVGLFLLFLGQQITLQSYGIFVAVLFGIAIHRAAIKEESLLAKHFGKNYTFYRKQVSRYV